MDPQDPAKLMAFHDKSAAEKVVSYMWYIHVLIAVNTEDRLRANIAPHLANPSPMITTTTTTGSGPLTDHLVLWLFNHTILARLVTNAPVFAQADGYTHILADVIPTSLCEEFCRRLYTLLFAKGIVEWPCGIDVPEPAIKAAEPIVVVDVPGVAELNKNAQPSPRKYYGGEDGVGTGLDGAVEDEGERDLRQSPAVSPKSGARPLWPRTPSLSSWDGGDDSHMQRGTYLGTAGSPLPWNHFHNWGEDENKHVAPDSVSGRRDPSEQPVSPVRSSTMQSETPDDTIFEVSPFPQKLGPHSRDTRWQWYNDHCSLDAASLEQGHPPGPVPCCRDPRLAYRQDISPGADALVV